MSTGAPPSASGAGAPDATDAAAMAVAILAGGASRRMGRDKAVLGWGGRTLLEHLAAMARDAGAVHLAVAGPPADRPALAGARWLQDTVPGCGPLGGLLAALEWRPRVLVIACDMPYLTAAWLAFLWRRALDAPGWTVAPGQPLCAVYTRALVPSLAQAAAENLAGTRRPLFSILAAAPQRVLAAEELARHGFGPELFRNLNDESDYARACAAGEGIHAG